MMFFATRAEMYFWLATLGGICATLGCAFGSASQQSQVKIEAVRAMPYYVETGAVRRTTNLFDPRLVLRNVVVGSPGGPDPLHRATIEDWDILFGTTVTYVEIDIQAARDFDLAQDLTLELSAYAGPSRQEIERRRVPLASIAVEPQGRWRVPFFIYGTGCELLELRVRLLDDRGYEEQVKTIPFVCGE